MAPPQCIRARAPTTGVGCRNRTVPPSLIPAFGQVGMSGHGTISLLLPHRPALHSAQIPNKGTNGSLFGRAERSSPTAAQRCAEGAGLCVGHVRQFGGESPLCNLMEVKH